MKYNELKEVFLKLTYLLRGYSLSDYTNSSSSAQRLIRYSYEINNQPFQEIEDGCSYLWVSYKDSPVDKIVNYSGVYNEIKDKIEYTNSQLRMITAHWMFYGESAQDEAFDFRQRLYGFQANDFLSQYDIKLVTDIPEVVLVHDEVNNQWWPRVDIDVDYYLTSTINEEVNTLVGVDIYLDTETKEKHIEIEREEN